jgi:hypothetical protein
VEPKKIDPCPHAVSFFNHRSKPSTPYLDCEPPWLRESKTLWENLFGSWKERLNTSNLEQAPLSSLVVCAARRIKFSTVKRECVKTIKRRSIVRTEPASIGQLGGIEIKERGKIARQ